MTYCLEIAPLVRLHEILVEIHDNGGLNTPSFQTTWDWGNCVGFFWPGLPEPMVDWSRGALGAESVAIETGTHFGSGALLLANHFGQCTTIELDGGLAEAARARFANDERIIVLHGSSDSHLSHLLRESQKPLFIWLDAHYSGIGTAGVEKPCPLLEEVKCILDYRNSNTVVAIDDVRMLVGIGGWPSLFDVIKPFSERGWSHAVIDDVLITASPELELDVEVLVSQSRARELGVISTRWVAT